MIKFPKYVHKAGQWCVTVVTPGKDKTTQTQSWFATLEEAMEYYKQEGKLI